MSPQNQWLEDVFPIETIPFYFGDMSVFRGVQFLLQLLKDVEFSIMPFKDYSKLCLLLLAGQSHLGSTPPKLQRNKSYVHSISLRG